MELMLTPSLSLFRWARNDSYSATLTNASAGLYAFVFDGFRINPLITWPRIQLQYILTETAGQLNLYSIPVYPRALESIIIIQGWKYVDPANHLVLKVGVGTADGSWSADGQFVAGTGNEKVFFRLSSQAIVDGNVSPAKVGASVSSSASVVFANPAVVAQLNSRYQGGVSASLIEVSFPAGANDIFYDPTIGSGDSPYSPSAPPAEDILPIVFGVLGAFIAVLIIIVLAVYFTRSRPGYDKVGAQ